jgi:flavin reductase (DIM6/NTAB) family NADH-FMN oxidoreductase RutF
MAFCKVTQLRKSMAVSFLASIRAPGSSEAMAHAVSHPALVAPADYIGAISQHVSSVCVITTEHNGQRFGLTATAVSSVTADPPRLLVCVNKSGMTHERILASQVFCVNVLAEEQD